MQAFAILVLMLFGGCSTLSFRGPASLEEVLRPGYEVELKSVADNTINGKYRIEYNGDLSLPYQVKVNVGGLNQIVARAKINDAFKKFFRQKPNIEISIKERKLWVEVGGLVSSPGRYLTQEDSQLGDLISQAGGLLRDTNNRALAKFITVKQGSVKTEVDLDNYFAGNSKVVEKWLGGEGIFFQNRRSDKQSSGVDLMGEVQSPGSIPFERGQSIFHYLKKAGGPTTSADLNKIQIIRQTPEGLKSIFMETEDPEDLPAIEGGDLVIVHTNRPSQFQTDVGIAANIFGILGTVVSAIALIVIAF